MSEQTTRVTVVVVGEQPVAIPTFPPIDGVRIRLRDRRSEFVSSPGTGIVKTFSYIFDVTPSVVGEFELGPVDVTLAKEGIQGSAVTLVVVPRDASAVAPTDPLIAEARFLREEVWEGEIVLYEARMTARVPIRDVRWRLPAFEGLQDPVRSTVERQTTRIGDPSGDITISTATIAKVAAGTGERTQPPAVAEVSQLVQRRTILPATRSRSVVATQAPLKIRPLPPAPPDFSGLVGDFRVISELGKTERVKIGESVEWNVTVLGSGVVDGLELPELRGLEGVRMYRDDSHAAGGMTQGEYVGRKTFRMVLVPTERGVIELPELEIVVFDPGEGRYRTLKTEVGKLSVLGSGQKLEFEDYAEEGGPPVDTEPIDLVEAWTWGLASTVPVAPVLPFLLVGVLLPGGLVLVGDGVRGARSWWAGRGRNRAEARGAQRLVEVPSDPAEQLAVCDLALREALADWKGVEVATMRRDAVVSELPTAVVTPVRQAFQVLDQARFADGRAPPDAVRRVREAIQKLEAA